MPEAVTTWMMTRGARAQAAARAITDGEIANVLADPDLDVPSAQHPRLRYVGRAGLRLTTAGGTASSGLPMWGSAGFARCAG